MAGQIGNTRCKTHDYRGPAIYLLTLKKPKGLPDYARLTGRSNGRNYTPAYPRSVPIGPAGNAIVKAIHELPLLEPSAKVLRWVLMPDHLHLLIQITGYLAKPLGVLVARFKARAKALAGNAFPLFEQGFNDQIVWENRDLGALFRYVDDNPRRLLVRREFPEWFDRAREVRIGQEEYEAYGNMLLLRHPWLQYVHVRKHWSEEERARYARRMLVLAAGGSVLAGAFISPFEREIRERAQAQGSRTILITAEQWEERYKPPRSDFELCAQGRLLILNTRRFTIPHNATITYEQAHELNRLGEEAVAVLSAANGPQ